MQGLASRITLRVGVDQPRKQIVESGIPLLVSANSLWNVKKQKFSGFSRYIGKEVALDSSGFVAMKLYGGYRWSAEQYVGLVEQIKPAWWAQMDFCCEPEIAESRSEIESRILLTVSGLKKCNEAAKSASVPLPIPVLQGWEPSDYASGPIYDGSIPDMVGVGSVCRRNLGGKNGLLAVMDAIDRKVPKQTTLHLFGVKGKALIYVYREFSKRKFSADSMSYSYASWKHSRKMGVPRTNELRAKFCNEWFCNMQRELSKDFQPTLFN